VAATGFTGALNETLESSKAFEVVRAYQAGVSYLDHGVGRLLGGLKDNGLCMIRLRLISCLVA